MAETIFRPPYVSPDWQNFTYVNISPYLWVAYRHKPLTGEIVMQMGTKPGGRGEQIGVLKVGFQRRYKATAVRDERWAAELRNGPVTIKGPNQVDICKLGISLQGPGIDDYQETQAYSYAQGGRIYVRGYGQTDGTYALTVYGHIQISFAPNETAYSEIITQFWQVWYGPEPPESRHEAPDPRLSALKPVKPVLTRVTLEEATRAGARPRG